MARVGIEELPEGIPSLRSEFGNWVLTTPQIKIY